MSEDRKPTVKLPAVVPPRPPAPRPSSPSSPDVAKHREAATEATRQKSDAEHGFRATVGAMISHTKTLEAALGAMRREQQHNDADQNGALLIIARELGLEGKLPPALQRSLPPPPNAPSKPQPPVLGRLERRAKSSQLVQLVIALAVLAKVVSELVAYLTH